MTGPRNRETRSTRITKAYGPNVAELEARCVRAEEALRGIRHDLRWRSDAMSHAICERIDVLLAAVPEKDKP